MGQMLLTLGLDNPAITIAGITERPGSEWVGRSGDALIPDARLAELTITDDSDLVFGECDAVIDFTAPGAALMHSALAAKHGIAHIIGATGFSDEELAALSQTAQDTVTVRAGNMSLGVNLLVQLTRQVAAALDADFDIEIVESHHNRKVDAPSGTALMLGEAAAQGRGVDLASHSDRGRDGITGARTRGHIGFAALRGGDIVGEHDVIFAGAGERISLRHIATDRAIFARGAYKAALWSRGKPNGEYSMLDVLGLAG
ncbi:MAG: 4-hydroxy-tetrahydrodipicolinate reductase [Neomegalonema sp.]|nr:4-hydroxy-tetrahydrodipicolinate reductase [Neomegalonema sp.]